MITSKYSFLFLTAGLLLFAGNLLADEVTPAVIPADTAQPAAVGKAAISTQTPLREAMKAAGQLAQAGKTDEAIAAYEKIGSLKNKKTESWVLNNEGLAYLEATPDQADKAVPILEKAVADQATNAVAWNNLGIAYERTNQLDKAADAYQKSIDASKADNSDPTKAQENLKNLQSTLSQITPQAGTGDAATPSAAGTSIPGSDASN